MIDFVVDRMVSDNSGRMVASKVPAQCNFRKKHARMAIPWDFQRDQNKWNSSSGTASACNIGHLDTEESLFEL